MIPVYASTGAFVTRKNNRNYRLIGPVGEQMHADGIEFLMFDSWNDEIREIRSYLKSTGHAFPVLHMDKSIGEILSEKAGGTLVPYLAGFSQEEDFYTVTFGLQTGGIPVRGTSYPYFAKMTVQSGRFRTVELRFLCAEQTGYTGTLFPSAWNYAHAEKTARPDTLRLYYDLTGLSKENVEATWYYTARNEVTQ